MWIKLKRDLTLNMPEPKAYKKGDKVDVPQWKGDALVNQRGDAEYCDPPKPRAKPTARKAVKKPTRNKMVSKEDTEDK